MANLISAIILFSMSVLLMLLPSMPRYSFKMFSANWRTAQFLPVFIVVLTGITCVVVGVLLLLGIFTVVFIQ